MRFGGSNRFRNRNKRANQLTGRRSRGGGQTLNLSAGASAQLLRLKQIAPKPAPMKIVRVPSNARPSSITATRVVIPPAPPILPPPRVNPPPRKSKPAAEPDYNPPVVRTAVQITGNTIQRNLQPKAVYETPKPFNTRFIPPPGGNLSNSALARLRSQTPVKPPVNRPTRPIAIGSPMVRGISTDRGFTDGVAASTVGGTLNEGLQPMAVLMDQYDARANEIRNNPFATQNTGQLEQEVINQIGVRPRGPVRIPPPPRVDVKPPIRTYPKPIPNPPLPKPDIPNKDFTLTVGSTPGGANIYMDGKKVGSAFTVITLPYKSILGVTKKITAQLTGYTNRLGRDAVYYTITGVTKTVQIKENYDTYEFDDVIEPDELVDIRRGPRGNFGIEDRGFGGFGGQGSPEGGFYGTNLNRRERDRFDRDKSPFGGRVTKKRRKVTKTRIK